MLYIVDARWTMSYLTVYAQIEAQLPRQFLSEMHVADIRPSMSVIAQIGILIMLITEVVVDDESCTIERLPLHILLNGETTIAQDVVVSRIADIALSRLYGANASR